MSGAVKKIAVSESREDDSTIVGPYPAVPGSHCNRKKKDRGLPMWDAEVPGDDCNGRRHGDGPQRQSIPKSDACYIGCRHRGFQTTFFQAEAGFHVPVVVRPKQRSALLKV